MKDDTMYKVSISLEIPNQEQRNKFLKDFRSLLMTQHASIKGKVKQGTEVEFFGGDYLSLFGFGVEEPAATPVEQSIDEQPVIEFHRVFGGRRKDEDE
jgi:hypothetical protein